MRVTDRQLTEARLALRQLCNQVRHELLRALAELVLLHGRQGIASQLCEPAAENTCKSVCFSEGKAVCLRCIWGRRVKTKMCDLSG
jgi:hypothetical protein